LVDGVINSGKNVRISGGKYPTLEHLLTEELTPNNGVLDLLKSLKNINTKPEFFSHYHQSLAAKKI
jgi:hypothetical protein